MKVTFVKKVVPSTQLIYFTCITKEADEINIFIQLVTHE